jgi:predicted dehydrogenase
MSKSDRRKFIKDSVAIGVAGAGLAGLKRPLLAQDRVAGAPVGANDRIRLALIGCGGQGSGDLRAALRVKNTECVALCDVDDAQSGKLSNTLQTQTGKAPGLVTRDFRRVLELKDLDAVIVGTPDHWHALPTVMACQAGKDVYVEKPLSLSIGEGRVMVDAARRYNRVVQMGTQQRSASHYLEAVNYVKSGKLGKIRLVRTWAYQDWTASHLRPSTTTSGSGRPRSARSTRTGSISTSGGTTTTPGV